MNLFINNLINYKMPKCDCTDCNGHRKYGPCICDDIIVIEDKVVKYSVKCDCTDCNGPRRKGPCLVESKFSKTSMTKITTF